MKKYTWQVLTLGLLMGGGSALQAAAVDQSVPVVDPAYTANQSTAVVKNPKHNRKHRRAEGTNRSSRPGTTTGVHAIEGVDTPGQMGTPSPTGETTPKKTTPE